MSVDEMNSNEDTNLSERVMFPVSIRAASL